MNYSSEGVKAHESSVPKRQAIAAFEMKTFLTNTRIKVFSIFRTMKTFNMTSNAHLNMYTLISTLK